MDLIRVIDGDTIVTSAGTVRIIGIDTPERGECGYEAARQRLIARLDDEAVRLRPDTLATDDEDRYGRLLRHVVVDGIHVGEFMIAQGYARPRYDSTDGYGPHDMERAHYAAVGAYPVFSCVAPTPSGTAAAGSAMAPAEATPAPPQPATPVPTAAPPAPTTAAPAPVHYANCAAARAAGAAPVTIGDPGYGRHLDRDGDGVGCEW